MNYLGRTKFNPDSGFKTTWKKARKKESEVHEHLQSYVQVVLRDAGDPELVHARAGQWSIADQGRLFQRRRAQAHPQLHHQGQEREAESLHRRSDRRLPRPLLPLLHAALPEGIPRQLGPAEDGSKGCPEKKNK